MRRNSFIEGVASFIAKCEWLRVALRPIFRLLYVNRIKASKRKMISENGLLLLQTVDAAFKENSIPYTLAFGTMLGAVRDHGFIKHDLDIDLAVPSSASSKVIEQILRGRGFELLRRIEVDEGNFAREETYLYKGVSVDFFYFYVDDEGKQYTSIFYSFEEKTGLSYSVEKYGGVLPMQVWLPLNFENPNYVDFESIKAPIPSNAMDFIKERYGANWAIPDPSFVYPKPGCSRYEYRKDKIGIVYSKQ